MAEPIIAISRKQALIFAVFFVLYEFLTYMANDMIMPGMISVVQSFHASESTVASSLTVYILGGASLQLLLGPLSDSYGRRPMMLSGAGLFFLFTLVIACSQSIHQFLIARFFQGMGLCFIGVVGYATVQEMFEEMDAIRLIAIMANAAILAPLLGPVIGAIVIHYASWRLIFVVIALGALIAYWGLWRFMPEPIGQTQKNGNVIHKTPFSLDKVLSNYKQLFTNSVFCSCFLALGFLGIPCVAWIALAPVILIKEAQLSVIEYGLWQLPIFGATIIGNWVLHHLTFQYQIKNIIYFGCIFLVIGLSLMVLLPLLIGNHYLCLIPGIIIYFFSLSIINAPLNRFALFVTSVGKGTVSAITSLSTMISGAAGIEIASYFYHSHNNLYFGLYCFTIGLIFLILLGLALFLGQDAIDNSNADPILKNQESI